MKNKIAPFIHYGVSTSKIIINYYFVIFFLTLFSFYKNGIVLYNNNYVGLIGLFKPVLMPLMGLIIGFIIELLSKIFIQNKKNIKINTLADSFLPLIGALIGLVSSININLVTLVITMALIIAGYKILPIFKRVNVIAAARLLCAGLLMLINHYSYLNILETTKNYSYNFIELLFGKTNGSLGSANLFLLIIILIFLCSSSIYKRYLPIYIISSYFITSLLILWFTKDINFWSNIINSELLFVSIIVAPIPIFSPYTKRGILTFGLMIGIIGSLAVTFISAREGLYLTVLVLSFGNKYFDLWPQGKIKK